VQPRDFLFTRSRRDVLTAVILPVGGALTGSVQRVVECFGGDDNDRRYSHLWRERQSQANAQDLRVLERTAGGGGSAALLRGESVRAGERKRPWPPRVSGAVDRLSGQ